MKSKGLGDSIEKITKATGINSITGSNENPDVAADDALTAFGKTVMAAAGISEERLDFRIPDGKIVRSLFA